MSKDSLIILFSKRPYQNKNIYKKASLDVIYSRTNEVVVVVAAPDSRVYIS